jgi:plastocyanin
LLALNGCKPSVYEDRSGENDDRSIAIAKDGLVFTPKCLTIAVGQSVVWQGNLSAHPLAPGNPDDPEAGSPASPIVSTSEGSRAEFAFPVAGTFPYYCAIHAFGAGRGMAGVVHVIEK